MYRIGIDVGGTNTDAVIMQGDNLLANTKSPTTEDVTSGVVQSLKTVLDETGINKAEIKAVMIGTTHFTNAVVERKHLSKTASIRLCLPAAQCLPPMVDWPEDMREAVGGHYWMASGGNEFDGREISALNEVELDDIARQIGKLGIDTVALCSVFSPVSDEMERTAMARLRQTLPDASFTLSSEIGRLGILERESAAIMNASLHRLSVRTVNAFAEALRSVDLNCPYYITQNDGTLMSADFVQAYPVLTFASGPTNSMRGASFLTGEQDAIVVDVGGTSTDVGALVKGFPRAASTAVDIGGVRTNFRMPDVFSIALGGGTIIEPDAPHTVGPESVGYRITEKARVFGGNTLTCTDVAVGLGLAHIGESSSMQSFDNQALRGIKQQIDNMVGMAVDRMRVSADRIPVLAVGGGSILIPEEIAGLPVHRPENFAVANAVGAAIGQISGEVDRIFSLSTLSREDALEQARTEATEKAIAAGARADSISVLDQEDVPLAYLPGNATRIRLKVVGTLDD
ncbi:MAG: hydantoinase/oxoprolinase N-terminal domain-containing protein [Granulosicoccus sp.]